MFELDENQQRSDALEFCQEFIATDLENRFVFGINEYAQSIYNSIEIALLNNYSW